MVLGDHFDLTDAERRILRHLVNGDAPQDIASQRQTSVQTVRTQIKSLLAKTGFSSQVDLMRQITTIGRRDPVEDPAIPSSGSDHHPRPAPRILRQFRPALGGMMEYTRIGPKDGRPVLYLHGLIDSLTMSDNIHAALHAHGIRLIAPVRPSFGGSTAYGSQETPEQGFADRVVALLDHLQIEAPVPVIGHMAGAFYAYHLAQRHPQRIAQIVAVAGAVPMAEPWQFAKMSKGHRIAGLTARRAPSLLRLLSSG